MAPVSVLLSFISPRRTPYRYFSVAGKKSRTHTVTITPKTKIPALVATDYLRKTKSTTVTSPINPPLDPVRKNDTSMRITETYATVFITWFRPGVDE